LCTLPGINQGVKQQSRHKKKMVAADEIDQESAQAVALTAMVDLAPEESRVVVGTQRRNPYLEPIYKPDRHHGLLNPNLT